MLKEKKINTTLETYSTGSLESFFQESWQNKFQNSYNEKPFAGLMLEVIKIRPEISISFIVKVRLSEGTYFKKEVSSRFLNIAIQTLQL